MDVEEVRFGKDGLIPVVVQDMNSKKVLILGFMSQEALVVTIETSHVTFWSRTRQALWTKGKTSGNFLQVSNILVNCEENSLLITVEPLGPACYTGAASCYELPSGQNRYLNRLEVLRTLKGQLRDQRALNDLGILVLGSVMVHEVE